MSAVRYTIKRSMSPDGKIDSVSVETTFETDGPDTQQVIDAITTSDLYAEHVRQNAPAKTYTAPAEQATAGGNVEIRGHIQAVFEGEVSQTTGKRGPGAIIIDGTKVKSFKKDAIAHAQNAKARGLAVTAVYTRNEKWKSNDLVSLTTVEAGNGA